MRKIKERTEASPEGESPPFGLANAALQELIRSTNEVTYDQVDALLSRDDIRSEQIEDIWRKLARWVWA
jgi:Sigma-70 factor, region 1.1